MNRMDNASLAVVFGPILMRAGRMQTDNQDGEALKEIHHQCKVLETILDGCDDIFESDE